jgi:hypothetical protein
MDINCGTLQLCLPDGKPGVIDRAMAPNGIQTHPWGRTGHISLSLLEEAWFTTAYVPIHVSRVTGFFSGMSVSFGG